MIRRIARPPPAGVVPSNHDRSARWLIHVNQRSAFFTILNETTGRDRRAMPCDTYQTVKEIAERLKVAEATVRHWIRAGELRAIDIGKGWRVAGTDLEGFLRRHETAPRAHDGPGREPAE
jgi:excisionase family DNA binding protein